MTISFVIPAYNEERIGACISSIQKEIARVQAHSSWQNLETEIIVVNNASTDNTKEVALSFAGVRVVDEPHKGLVRARAAGHRAASGDIVANIDADVILPAGWLEHVIDAFQKDQKLVALSGPFIYHDISWWSRAWVKIFYGLAFIAYIISRFLLRIGSMVQGGNFVVRRGAMDTAGGYDTTIEFYGEDTDVARRLHKVGKVKWTFRLPVYTSGRRFKSEGIIATSMRYTANFFWITFFGRPFSNKYKDVRPK